MLRILEKNHVGFVDGSETNWKVGSGSGSEKNHSRSTTLLGDFSGQLFTSRFYYGTTHFQMKIYLFSQVSQMCQKHRTLFQIYQPPVAICFLLKATQWHLYLIKTLLSRVCIRQNNIFEKSEDADCNFCSHFAHLLKKVFFRHHSYACVFRFYRNNHIFGIVQYTVYTLPWYTWKKNGALLLT
jgi:hypothetical protein